MEQHVGVQYFLARIKEFEQRYGMESWKFRFLYENNREALSGYNARAAVDYSEWAFLYDNVDEMLCESPPGVVGETDGQKPEGSSGFCFSGGIGDYFSASLSRQCHKPALEEEGGECSREYRGANFATP